MLVKRWALSWIGSIIGETGGDCGGQLILVVEMRRREGRARARFAIGQSKTTMRHGVCMYLFPSGTGNSDSCRYCGACTWSHPEPWRCRHREGFTGGEAESVPCSIRGERHEPYCDAGIRDTQKNHSFSTFYVKWVDILTALLWRVELPCIYKPSRDANSLS